MIIDSAPDAPAYVLADSKRMVQVREMGSKRGVCVGVHVCMCVYVCVSVCGCREGGAGEQQPTRGLFNPLHVQGEVPMLVQLCTHFQLCYFRMDHPPLTPPPLLPLLLFPDPRWLPLSGCPCHCEGLCSPARVWREGCLCRQADTRVCHRVLCCGHCHGGCV